MREQVVVLTRDSGGNYRVTNTQNTLIVLVGNRIHSDTVTELVSNPDINVRIDRKRKRDELRNPIL